MQEPKLDQEEFLKLRTMVLKDLKPYQERNNHHNYARNCKYTSRILEGCE